MTRHILLDSFPLGLISTPALGAAALPVAAWVAACRAAGHEIYIPEVIDYELRRELLRARKVNSVRKLDSLKATLNFLPITSAAMLLAADLWAQSRQRGAPTGDPKKLDIDVILAAQALTHARTLGIPSGDLVVATSNVGHLAQFVPAELWTNIPP